MRQIFIPHAGPASAFQILSSGNLVPKNDQLQISVKAAGINFEDILARKGLYPDCPAYPCVLGFEVSGTVIDVGPAADRKWIGRHVICLTKFGGYSDLICLSQADVILKPEWMSFEEAASFPAAYLTAWILLNEMGSLRKGHTLLIQDVGSSVSLAAIDFAKHIGAKTIGTGTSAMKEFTKSRGLDEFIDSQIEDVKTRVMEITQNEGVELIIDPIGGASWNLNYEMLRIGGRLGMYGVSSVTESPDNNLYARLKSFASHFLHMPKWGPLELMDKNRSVFGVKFLNLIGDKRQSIWLKSILDGIEEGWVKPHIDSVFSFDDVEKAHEHIESCKCKGKVVLVPTRDDVKFYYARKAQSIN